MSFRAFIDQDHEEGAAMVLEDEEGKVVLRKDDDGKPCRTGTMWTAAAHILTAVVGSGVLSLPWSIAQLGWIGGGIVTLFFAYVTYYASLLLADCYRSPDSITGQRNYTYMDAVKANLGGVHVWICGLAQYSNLFGITVSYVITASSSMAMVKRTLCFHRHGKTAKCNTELHAFMGIFAAVQIIFAQIPDLARLWWLSIIATITSFFYCLTGLGLAIAKVSGGSLHGTISGISVGNSVSPSTKAFQIFQAFGNIAFAFSFSVVLIEIQDTLKSPPAENKQMKKATMIGIVITTLFYTSVASMGYLAFGSAAPGNLLAGFYEPYWLVIMANISIVIHLTGSYQLCSRPIFAEAEQYAIERWGKRMKKVKWIRFGWRASYVMVTVLMAMLFPFFNDVVGLIGACGFWPLTVYFPVQMYIKQSGVVIGSSKWIGLQIMSFLCFVVSVAAAIGSTEGIFYDLRHYSPFKLSQ